MGFRAPGPSDGRRAYVATAVHGLSFAAQRVPQRQWGSRRFLAHRSAGGPLGLPRRAHPRRAAHRSGLPLFDREIRSGKMWGKAGPCNTNATRSDFMADYSLGLDGSLVFSAIISGALVVHGGFDHWWRGNPSSIPNAIRRQYLRPDKSLLARLTNIVWILAIVIPSVLAALFGITCLFFYSVANFTLNAISTSTGSLVSREIANGAIALRR